MKPNSNASKILKYVYLKNKPVSSIEISKDLGIQRNHIGSFSRYLVSRAILKMVLKNRISYYHISPYSKNYVKQTLEDLENEE